VNSFEKALPKVVPNNFSGGTLTWEKVFMLSTILFMQRKCIQERKSFGIYLQLFLFIMKKYTFQKSLNKPLSKENKKFF